MTMQTTRDISLAFLMLIILLACTPPFAVDQPDSVAPPATQPVAGMVATEPIPTVDPPILPTSTQAPEPTPTAISAPQIDSNELSSYQQAMLPAFQPEVELIAAEGASRYDLEVGLDPKSFNSPTGLILKGRETIHYTNQESIPLSELYLHLYPNLPGYGGQMEVQTVMINDQSVTWQLVAEESALHLPLLTPLPPGASANLTLTYEATVPAQPQRGYNIFSFTDGTAALAGFYPAMAVYDETGWNIEVPPVYGDATYLDISLYQVKLTVPADMVVAASGSLLEEELHENGTKTLSMASGPVRDFYIAFRSDFQVMSDSIDGITVNSYYPPSLEKEGQLALQHAIDSLRIFNRDFGPYPYAEFDLVATPTTAGGVEYPGIVVVAENVYDQQGIFFPHVIAHEVAHQWWYNLVGNDQVDEPWLDESLTNYSTVLYWEEVSGKDTAEDVISTFFLGPYRRVKEQESDQSVLGAVSDYNQSNYGTFIYGKGPLFFHALRQEVGEEIYLKIMQTYLANYKYKIAHTEDFLEIIETVSGRSATPLVETWLQGQ